MTPNDVVAAEALVTFINENLYECDPNGGNGEVKPREISRFTPIWKQSKGNLKLGTPLDNWVEFSYAPVVDPSGNYNTEVEIDGYLHTKNFESDPAGEGYNVWYPADEQEFLPENGDYVGDALLWIPGGRNMFAGQCFFTTRGTQGPHLIFCFAEHGEWETNHPLPAGYIGEIKVKWNLRYRINMA